MYDAPFNPFSQNIAIIKGYFKRPAVLMLAIFNALSLAISALSVFFLLPASNQINQQSLSANSEFFEQLGIDSETFSQVYSGLTGVSSVISMIPSLALTIVLVIGLILIYVKSRKEDPAQTPMAGFTMWMVISIIQMVGAIVASALLLIFLLIFVIAAVAMSSSSGTGAETTAIIAVILLVIFGLTIFMLLFYSINQLRYVKSARNSMRAIELSDKGAGAYGAANIIFAAFMGLSVVALIVSMMILWSVPKSELSSVGFDLSLYNTLFIYVLAVSAYSIALYILQAIVALGYKKYINKIKFGYKPAEIPEAPYQPAAPQTAYQPPVSPAQPVSPAAPSYARPAYCPACGSPLEPDAAFCTHCGSQIR